MTPEERKTMRLQRLNKKGMGVAGKLADLMAGKDISLSQIGLNGIDMIDDKEQRLRAFLDMVNQSRKIILSDDYASKIVGEDPKRQLFLDDNPWLEAAKPDVAGSEDGDA